MLQGHTRPPRLCVKKMVCAPPPLSLVCEWPFGGGAERTLSADAREIRDPSLADRIGWPDDAPEKLDGGFPAQMN